MSYSHLTQSVKIPDSVIFDRDYTNAEACLLIGSSRSLKNVFEAASTR